FIVHTDHQNLVHLLGKIQGEGSKILSQKVERWLTDLSGYRYHIAHISGILNYWADLLSRWRSEPFMVRRTKLVKRLKFPEDGQAEERLTGIAETAWRRFRAGQWSSPTVQYSVDGESEVVPTLPSPAD